MNLTSSSTSLHSGTCTHIFLSRMLCTSLNSGQSLRAPPILSSDSIYYRILSPDRVHSGSLNCQSSFSQSLRHSNRSIFGRRDTSQFLWIRGKQICRAVRGDGDAEIEGITKKKPAVERSESANEELLLFFFQLDLTTRLQRALNQDAYEIAQQLRERIAEVEQEVARQREAKMGSVSSKDEAQDKAITLLQLKAELQKLIEDENYAGAGVLKNQISSLEGESLAAQAKAMVYRQLNFQFRLGQKVKHKLYGYRGVICGMDPLCCETSKWTETAGVDELPRGRNQPFYQVSSYKSRFVSVTHYEELSVMLFASS